VARHNREGSGADQRGFEYGVSYQPDWLKQVKVTRQLETGRQSTKTLFRNPNGPEAEPGERIRTRIVSADQALDFEVALIDPRAAVRRVRIAYEVPGDERPHRRGRVHAGKRGSFGRLAGRARRDARRRPLPRLRSGHGDSYLFARPCTP
jgi:hypothetical protein